MNKQTAAVVLGVISLIGAIVLFAIGKNEGATLVLAVATSSASWLHGFSTYNPKIDRS